jgi:hypothetical protein
LIQGFISYGKKGFTQKCELQRPQVFMPLFMGIVSTFFSKMDKKNFAITFEALDQALSKLGL